MLQYTCPNCNGQLVYDSDKQILICESCQSEIDPYSLNEPTPSATCKSCGSPIEVESNVYSGLCESCEASYINEEALSQPDPPEYMAPFDIKPKEAEQKFIEWLSTRRWIPEDLRKDIRISARNRYILPFHCYGYYNKGSQLFDCVKTRTVGSGKNRRTVHDHYDVWVKGEVVIEDYPVDAMEELKDEIVDFIAPFNNDKCAEFVTPLFCGVQAKRQDYSAIEM